MLAADLGDWQSRVLATGKNAIVNWSRTDLADRLRMITFSPRIGAAPLTFRWPDAGRPVDHVRIVFAEEWMARRERRPLCDVGAHVYFMSPKTGELVEVT